MPRYYFDVREAGNLAVDEEGIELLDIEAARKRWRDPWWTWPAMRFAEIPGIPSRTIWQSKFAM